MLVGHLGVGLALKSRAPERNLGWFIGASLVSDFLLWILVILGIESVYIPENYPAIRYLTFSFPYSHSLTGTLVQSLLFFLAGTWKFGKRTGWLLAAAVFLHFVCDLIVHVPEIPIYGKQPPFLGLALWENIYLALLLELAILLYGLYLYGRSTNSAVHFGRYGILVLMAFVTLIAFTGQLFGPPPPPGAALAGNSLALLTIVLILAHLLDKRRSGRRDKTPVAS